MRRRVIGWLLIAPLVLLAKGREWKSGRVASVEIRDFMTGRNNNKIDHRYICTVSDGELNYVVEFEKPLKIAVNDNVQFFPDKDNLIVVDADGKERSARIEKRERVR